MARVWILRSFIVVWIIVCSFVFYWLVLDYEPNAKITDIKIPDGVECELMVDV